MKTLPSIAAVILLSGATDAGAREVQPAHNTPVPGNCPLLVTFASHGAGIDRPTLERVEHYLAEERTVTGVSRHPWGREGELTLCVRARGQADLIRVADRIRASLPARTRGPVTVESRVRRW